MLKGALSPHIYNYAMEVKYESQSEQDQDMEWDMVEKVEDKLKVVDPLETQEKIPETDQKPIPLSNTDAQMDEPESVESKFWATGDPFESIPELSTPKLLQAPFPVPPLFPFSRTTVYLLMSPECIQKTPKSLILRGTSLHEPLEPEFPVRKLSEPGKKIHQMAAKKGMQELEEGRGWIYTARNQQTNVLLKDQYPSCFDQMVQREAVRLGMQFQVDGKHCSFVAVADNERQTKQIINIPSESEGSDGDEDDSDEEMVFGFFDSPVESESKRKDLRELAATQGSTRGSWASQDSGDAGKLAIETIGDRRSGGGDGSDRGGGGGRGTIPPRQSRGASMRSADDFGGEKSAVEKASSLSLSPSSAAPPPRPASPTGGMKRIRKARKASSAKAYVPPSPPETDNEKVHALIDMQCFEGYWSFDSKLLAILGLPAHRVRHQRAFVTVLVIHRLEVNMAAGKICGIWWLTRRRVGWWV